MRDGRGVLLARHVGGDFLVGSLTLDTAVRQLLQRLLQTSDQLLDPPGRLPVGGFDIAVEAEVADDLDVVLQVVEDQQRVREQENGLGHTEYVVLRLGHPRLEVAHNLVSQVAHGAACKPRQSFDRHELEAPQLGFDLDQRVAAHAIAADTAATPQHAIRLRADEAVARQSLASLHALEQEGVPAPRDFQVGADGRFEVCRNFGVERTEVALGC